MRRLNPISEDGSHEEDDKNTMRLVEGISHPSRAEDVQDLHRLQKSSTKPRQGTLECCAAFMPDNVSESGYRRSAVPLQMTLAKLPRFPKHSDQAPGRKLQSFMLSQSQSYSRCTLTLDVHVQGWA